MRGYVEWVDVLPAVSYLSADVASGATTMPVSDDAELTQARQVRVAETFIVDVVSVAGDVVTIAAPTPEAFEAGLPVEAWPLATVTVAGVMLADSPDPGLERAIVGQELQGTKALAVGLREHEAREVVTLEQRPEGLTIVAVDGRLKFDGTVIDPDTLPPSPPPTPVAPTSSPSLTVTGTSESLVIEAEAVDPSVLIEYHVSDDPDFEPTLGDTATRSGLPTRATVYVLTEGPDGSPLALGTTYYVRAIAYNDAGTADPSLVAWGALNPDALNQIILARLVAGFILTGRIQVGGIVIDANDGILIPQPDGRAIVFPSNGAPADIAAHLMAYSLTVRDALTIQGISNLISAGAGVTVASGVSAPRRAPTVERYYPNVATTYAGDFAAIHRGLCLSIEGNALLSTTAFFGSSWVARMNLDGSYAGDPLITWSNFHAEGGITRIGSNYYVLGVDVGTGSRANRWFVKRLDSTFVETAEWEWTPSSARTHRPTIGTNGTDLAIAWANTGQVVVRYYTPSSGATTGAFSYNHGGTTGFNLTGLHHANITGQDRVLVARARSILALNAATGARDTTREWLLAGSSDLLGLGFDGTRFRHLDNQGRMWTYSTLAADTGRVIDYSWYDSDPAGTGTHETDRGPALSFTQVARSYLRVQTDEPYDTGLPDDPDSVRIWIGGQRQTPDQAPGATARIIEIPTTGTTTKAPSFALAGTSAGFIESAEPVGWKLHGNGKAEVERAPEAPVDIANKEYVDLLHGFVRRDNSGSQTFNTGTEDYVAFGLSTDTDGSWTYTTSPNRRMVCQQPGIYTLTFSVAWAQNSNGRRTIVTEINGTRAERLDQNSGAFQIGQQIIITRRFDVGDTASLVAFQNAGANVNLTLASITIVKVGA